MYFLVRESNVEWDSFIDKGDYFIIKHHKLSEDKYPDSYIKIIKKTNQVIFNKAENAKQSWIDFNMVEPALIDI